MSINWQSLALRIINTTWLYDLFVILQHGSSETWNHVMLRPQFCDLALIYIQENCGIFLCPAAFKASLDRLGCSWKTPLRWRRGQIHLRGKRDRYLQHPPPFSFHSSSSSACIICTLAKTMELQTAVQLMTRHQYQLVVMWYFHPKNDKRRRRRYFFLTLAQNHFLWRTLQSCLNGIWTEI